MSPRKSVVALVYDFDGTLAPGNMQEHSFIPELGLSKQKFWAEVVKEAETHQGDQILMYMQLMIERAGNSVPIRRADIRNHGKNVKLFPGVQRWFGRINEYASQRNLKVRHYVISSGNREMIMGTRIAREFDRIYASAFRYDQHDVAMGPALAINYTTKTQYLFRINKGVLDVTNHQELNEWVDRDKRPVPFKRMIFIGDGSTDVPCMRLVKQQGGFSIAVYKPNSKSDKAKKLTDQGRVDLVAPANYCPGKKLDSVVKKRLDLIAAEIDFRRSTS